MELQSEIEIFFEEERGKAINPEQNLEMACSKYSDGNKKKTNMQFGNIDAFGINIS